MPCDRRTLFHDVTLSPEQEPMEASACGFASSHESSPRETGGLRYLRYDERRPVVPGMDHQMGNLRCLLAEAHASGRLAVLPKLRLDARHNFGVRNDWQWDTYLDLHASRLVDARGREHPLPIVRHLPDSVALPFMLEPGQRTPDTARDHVLVVRRIEHYNFRHDVPEELRPRIRLRIRHSMQVRELAGPVVANLLARGKGRFVAVHARRGDRLWQYPRHLTDPSGIRNHLIEQDVPDNSVVFILSDERDSAFWEPLKEHYDLARYAAYPRLAALVSRAAGHRPDNYLLYAVEKEIMAAAWMRIETLPGHRGTAPHSLLVDEGSWARFLRRRRHPGRRLMRELQQFPRRVVRRLRRTLGNGSDG